MQVLSEKLKSGLFTSMLAEHEIKSISIGIHCPIQVSPLAFDFDVGFISIPSATAIDGSVLL